MRHKGGGAIAFPDFCKNIRNTKAIETGMILLNMDMKNQLLCVFFIDLYSPR